jgi:hypothetical protein
MLHLQPSRIRQLIEQMLTEMVDRAQGRYSNHTGRRHLATGYRLRPIPNGFHHCAISWDVNKAVPHLNFRTLRRNAAIDIDHPSLAKIRLELPMTCRSLIPPERCCAIQSFYEPTDYSRQDRK